LPANIRLGCKWMVVANTLAYYDVATIMTVKFLIVHAQGVVFTNVIFFITYKLADKLECFYGKPSYLVFCNTGMIS
jgi:hypothetical protein